jgi:hypothetical protein
MKRDRSANKNSFYHAAAFLVMYGLTAFAQESHVYTSGGIVDDWTTASQV